MIRSCLFMVMVAVTVQGEAPKPVPVQYKDLVGSWDMDRGNGFTFKQTFWADGHSDCIHVNGDCNFYGVWTQARADEVTVAEESHRQPGNVPEGFEVEFTLMVKLAKWKGAKLERAELEGMYRGNKVKVVLTRMLP